MDNKSSNLRKLIILNNQETADFLDKCGRKKGAIVSLALSEFIDKYSLKDKKDEEIKQFLKNYDYIKSVASKNYGMPIVLSTPAVVNSPETKTVEEPVAEKKEPKQDEDKSPDELKGFLKGFGI